MLEEAAASWNRIERLNQAFGPSGPHPAQQKAIQAVFARRKRIVQVDCGRKWGKTEWLIYCLYRQALLRPGQYYYIAPFQKQAKELIWANNRLQGFFPEAIAEINNSEMRVTLTNGSFIKLDGADNFDSYRGVNPHGIVYDEFKDHRPEFHKAMGPNLATHRAQLILAGTPPSETAMPLSDDPVEALAMMHAYDIMAKVCQTRDNCAYFNWPTWANPHIDKQWLREEKEILFARGEEAEWYREYEAKRVSGGLDNIFPMFDPPTHIVPHEDLMESLTKDMHKLEWYVTVDPGSATVFAALLSAYNPKTEESYHLDEVYLRTLEETTTANVIREIRGKKRDLHKYHPTLRFTCDWQQFYDEAATWFANEALHSFDEHFSPTKKALVSKEAGLSMIKDQLLKKRTLISDRCRYLAWEVTNYKRDEKTKKIPKINDHLIDCWRYFNHGSGVTLKKHRYISADVEPDAPRGFTPEQDIAAWQAEQGHIPGAPDVLEPGQMEWLED